jgi:hypothetical protein
LVPENFIVEESITFQKDPSVNEGVTTGRKTVKTSNSPAAPQEENVLSDAIHQGPLIFDPLPLEGEDT